MAWRFERGEPLDAAFRRVAHDEIERIRASLSDPGLEPAQAIHQARRSFKRLRALLRLARPALGDAFAAPDRRWRDAGRLLASSRDATVTLEAYDRIAAGGQGTPPSMATSALRKALVEQHVIEDRAIVDQHMRDVLATLDGAGRESAALPWPSGKGQLRHGLKKSQARLKRSWKAARDLPEPKELHAWRKRVKDYAAQTSLVRFALPHDLKVSRSDSKELADLLGEGHDLSMLRERLQRVGAPVLRRSRDRLVKAIDDRRAVLCEAAFEKGTPLSSRRPKAFAKEIASRLD